MILTLKRLTCLVGVAVAVGLSSNASAGTINMIIGNVDVQFVGAADGGLLHEVSDPDPVSDPAVMPPDPGEAQSVSSTEFEVDGVTPPGGLLMNPPDQLFLDLNVPNIGGTLTFDTLVQDAGGPGIFTWFTSTGEFLRLEFDAINYTVVDIPLPSLGLFTFFTEATVVSQDLPGALAFEEDVLLSYTATDAMFLTGGSLALASGALTITGTMVIPEPTTLSLLGLLLSGGSTLMLRHRS